MKNWFMLSLIGRDQPSMVAQLSAGLCKNGCNLGDSSMVRLGQYFTIMLMVEHDGEKEKLESIVASICEPLKLNANLVELEDGAQHHCEPDIRISLYADDRVGIVEDATTPLAQAGLNILHLESNIGEASEAGTYYIHLEGTISGGLDALYKALEKLESEKGIQSQLIPINTQVT
ncbi:MAG: ACT domain-containing protein [Nitrospinaceae bacterium]|jgi:glycine cleavage system transcriptional repressor|nr:ACT domain-containing protein [Nitrospina sp.]MBT5377161.1 ACT domain-containing protein [Nitrospinaceae bacterium]MBT5868160.1 ACT domain-containing protein [Nitrospinaceae bacterium]MBT6346860.1 ACT domain-containing protein [Nitrospina sp.]